MEAHHLSAFRQNVSTQVVQLVAAGSNDYTKAISAAISSVGGRHAPLSATMNLLQSVNPDAMVKRLLKDGLLVPGWGSSFNKGEADPLWADVDSILSLNYFDLYQTIQTITRALHSAGKNIQPNPSTYTSACALALGIPAKVAPFIFITGRLSAWSEIAASQL